MKLADASNRMNRLAIINPNQNGLSGFEMNSTKNLMRKGLNISMTISRRPREKENRNSFM